MIETKMFDYKIDKIMEHRSNKEHMESYAKT